jgi:hypothetical protein
MRSPWWVLAAALVQIAFLAGCGDNATAPVRCDDRVFCNGVERLVDGACVKVPANPCDDAQDCTLDVCDEATQTCDHIPMGESCAVCRQENCTPDCAGRQCGDDGCGGSCGACGGAMGCTPTGSCADATGAGTCASPRPLAVAFTTQVLTGDTTPSVHQTIPTCNSTSTAVEERSAPRVAAEHEVFRDGHLRHEMQFLIDHRDSGRECCGGRVEDDTRAVDDHAPRRWHLSAAEDFKERRLAGAVFTHEAVHAS